MSISFQTRIVPFRFLILHASLAVLVIAVVSFSMTPPAAGQQARQRTRRVEKKEDSSGREAQDKPAKAPNAQNAKGKPDEKPAGWPLVTRDEKGKLQWPRPRTRERQGHRDRMVREQIAGERALRSGIHDARVLGAMRAVPRHKFVPPARRDSAYRDTPLPIGYGQTISQPSIVALMTDRLKLKPGAKVLEIGTGSGYQAAVLSELTPYVYTIEIVEPLHKKVVKRFEQLGYKTINAKLADGYDGWAEHAPFDAIIVTCAAGHVPPPLWDQLKRGGRMVIPVGQVHQTQRLIVLEKLQSGGQVSKSILPVRFVPMTGKSQQP